MSLNSALIPWEHVAWCKLHTMFGVTPDVKSLPTNSTTVHTSSDFVLMDKKQIKATAAT